MRALRIAIVGKRRESLHIGGMDETASISLLEQRRHRLLNTLHTWLLASGSLALLAVTAFVFGGPAGVLVALIFGGLTLAAVQRVSPHLVLRMYKAQPVSRLQFPIGVDIVEKLAVRAGLPAVPKLHVIPSQMMNAFAVGRRVDSAIAITDALARRLSARELAGVLAHEISHIAHEDLRVMAFADMVSRYTSFMSTVGIFSLFLNLLGAAGGYGQPVPWLGVLVLIVAPTIGGILQLALSRTREFDADLGAAMLTGDPDGLASALLKLERVQGRLWEGMMLPGGRIPNPSVLRTHPPTAERIARLNRLKIAPEGAPEQGPLLWPDAISRPAVRRGSPVPGIRGRLDRCADAELHRIARHIADSCGAPQDADSSETAGIGHLKAPDGRPRIRIRHGGVWW
jgi:heat shock protein HtpX